MVTAFRPASLTGTLPPTIYFDISVVLEEFVHITTEGSQSLVRSGWGLWLGQATQTDAVSSVRLQTFETGIARYRICMTTLAVEQYRMATEVLILVRERGQCTCPPLFLGVNTERSHQS